MQTRTTPYASLIFSRERDGMQAIMVYLSPLDAVLDAANFTETFSVEPLENLRDAPATLTQLVHFDLAPDASRPFRLQLDAATCAWLEQLHADVGMADYSATVRLLDDGPYEDLARRHGAVAFLWMKNARKNIKTVKGITHCALYDLFDQRWRFTTVPEDRIRAMFPEMASLEEAAAR